MSWTSVHVFFPDLSRAYNIELLRVDYNRNNLRGNKNHFELAEGSSYQGFKLLRVKLQ